MRVPSPEQPFAYDSNIFRRGFWPADWVSSEQFHDNAPRVVAFKNEFSVASLTTTTIHVSADERYELFLDGQRIGRGSERGDRRNWCFESYEITLEPGDHCIVARTWWLGSAHHAGQGKPYEWDAGLAPYAQFTVRHAFLLAAEGELQALLSTGKGNWTCLPMDGYSYLSKREAWGTGCRVGIDGSKYPWGFEAGAGEGWKPVISIAQAFDVKARDCLAIWHLRPSLLPPMLEEKIQVGTTRIVQDINFAESRSVVADLSQNLSTELPAWNNLLKGNQSVTIPANASRRVIIDLENYYCGYPDLTLSGGAGSKIQINWAEAMYTRAKNPEESAAHVPKSNRNDVDGHYFYGVGDTFLPDGSAGRTYSTLWWECGRYVEFVFETREEPLTLEAFSIRETHYPYNFESTFESSDPKLQEIIPFALRTLEMCSHETYMDCPFYEQLMYVGDTRLEVLVTHVTNRDDSLPKKAVWLFDESRGPSGLTFSRYPSNVTQFIPPFSLWWVNMVHDLAMWRNRPEFIKERLIGVRAVLEFFRDLVTNDGLMAAPDGWNYFDWIGGLHEVPPGTYDSLYNLQFILALQAGAELESAFGEPALAERHRSLAESLGKRLFETFWNVERSLLSHDPEQTKFSEHVQALAIIAGIVPSNELQKIKISLLNDPTLIRTTIYFTHYLFEAYRILGEIDVLYKRLDLWYGLRAQGFKTTIESPEPSRSDCHAWGAHPVFHFYASVLGIRPKSFGFNEVVIQPQLGSLEWAKGKMVHPNGFVEVDIHGPKATITLPVGVTGTLIWKGSEHPLHSGSQIFNS